MTYSSEDQLKRREDEEAAAAASKTKGKSKSLEADEWIAILVAFGVIGSIFFWSLRPQSAANGGGWLGRGDVGLVGEANSADGNDATIAIATGNGEAKVETDLDKASVEVAGNTGKLSSPSANLGNALGDKDSGVSLLPSRGQVAGVAAAGGAIAAGAASGTDAAEVPTEAAVTTEATIPTPEPEATPPEATTPETAPPETEAAAPLQVASEALDTSVPEVAADSWVAPFAQSLTEAERFGALPTPDGTGEAAAAFDIDAPVTRAEFAALINEAEQANGDAAIAASEFDDIDETFWAAQGIAGASNAGFMSGYATDSGLAFRPGEQIPRWQVFVTLASGLNLTSPEDPDAILNGYNIEGVPDWAKGQVAATLQEGLVVNPNSTTDLEATRPATRGEATAMLQLVLEREGKVEPVDASDVVIQAQ